MAVSSRNPLHLIAGNNDYRTVDLPGVPCPTGTTSPCKPTGDAWLGFFASVDGGNTWTSTLVPGYPQDQSSTGTGSPLHGYTTGADPSVRAGTNGMFYYGGLVFNRDSSGSAVFVARYVDGNNKQGSNTVSYIDAHVIATGATNNFLDKPAIAVDMPRPGGATCSVSASADGTVPASSIPAGNIYVAYTQFTGPQSSNISAIMFSESSNCGATWSTPVQVSQMVGHQQTNQGAALAIDPSTGNVYVVWRIFAGAGQSDALAGVAWQYSSKSFTPMVNANIKPFDQGTTDVSFRTNAYPSIAVDSSGIVYLACSLRGTSTSGPTGGDARIEVLAGKPSYGSGTQIKSMQYKGPVIVDNYNGRGHQIMPALAFSSGKLTVAWYDFRDDDQVDVFSATGGGNYTGKEEYPAGVTPVFSTVIADPTSPYSPNQRRHTVDIRAAQALSGFPPSFKPSVMVSQYSYGSPVVITDNLAGDSENIQQLDFDAPNLPLFQLGTVPFVGDYIDVAGPTFVSYLSGTLEMWRFNDQASDPDHTHVVWTDNRNVVQPADNNWANYTPVGVYGGTSTFDPTQQAPNCIQGQTGTRNQDIFTASLSPGIIMGSKGNFIQPSSGSPTPTTRQYPVTVENPTTQTLYYRLTIQNQPVHGTASFLQYPVTGLPSPLTQLTVTIPPNSSASRSVFIASTDANPVVTINAAQTDGSNNLTPNGLASSTALNSDTSNPNISNPNISNVELYNPNISNPNISNPNISNPNISNPNISNPNISNLNVPNPNISNVTVANPNISNPNISNPNISNPNISNPNISNPNISNAAISGEITDANYMVTNAGNTATTYSLTLLQYQPPPQGINVQLIVSGVYLTPVANGCTLAVEAHYNPIVNITKPAFVTVGSTIPSGPPAASAPTFTLQPGEQAMITLRVYDPNASTPQQALQDYNPTTATAPVIMSGGINSNVLPPPLGTSISILSISTSTLPQVVVNSVLNTTLAASGGHGSYTWSAVSTSLPPGITLSSAGVLSGTATVPGTYNVSVQVSDLSNQTAQRSLTLVVVKPTLTIATTTLPQGQYDAVYSANLAATGGTAPYTWATNNALPVGLQLNTTSGALSGTPAQAGVGTVAVTVADSASNVATANLPLTIGLATAYAGGQNCYMPYPTTPLYPSGVTWTVNSSSFPNPGQLSILHGNVLTGCLSGGNGLNSIPTGNYNIGFTPSSGTGFTLPLHVVGQDQFTNGTYFADTGGVNNLPPSGYQQGVVTPGQAFTYNPGYWGPSAASGSFVFGFNGGASQACVGASTTSTAISLTTPSTPARYDILFDGTSQNCPAAFPASPPPLIIDSVDAVGTTVIASNLTVTGTSISSTASSVQTQTAPNVLAVGLQPSGTTFPVTVSLNYLLTQDPACPGCIDQIQVGLSSDAVPQLCAYSGGTPATSPTNSPVSVNLNVPNVLGRYYVSIDRSLDFGCLQTYNSWWSGGPFPAHYVAIVDVQ